MNIMVRQALKEALNETMMEICKGIDDGEFEAKEAYCPCGQSEHVLNAKYCGKCGRKLERAVQPTLSNCAYL